MPLFNKRKPFSYELIREGEDVIVRIDLEQFPNIPSLELNPMIMSRTMDILAEVGNATKLIFYQRRDYEYDYEQTLMLLEIAKLQNSFVKQKIISYYNIKEPKEYAELQNLVFNILKSDPIGCYVKLKRILRGEEIKLEKGIKNEKVLSLLKHLIDSLEKTRLIKSVKTYVAGYNIGDRSVYEKIFSSNIKPDFMVSKLMASYPQEGEELESYSVGNTEVVIFSLPDTIQYLYHITPPEFKLSEEKYEILDQAKNIMAEHKPTRAEFIDPKRVRQVFFNVGRALIEELASNKGYRFREREIDELTNILVRYTIGFGLIEILLQDEKIQDITINSPTGTPIFIVHQDYTDCITNIYPSETDTESWASKLRMISGRPLDEANPILDTGLEIPGAYARVAVITEPLNPFGLAYAFRRHRDMPWTLPLFIKNRMIDPLSAGLLSFIIDGSRTMLIAGTRSAGKTSLLGSILTEIMRKYRIITIEDTLELPTSALRRYGYNSQPMKVAAALTKGTSEVPADEGIRTTLRMGDSALIIGEIRSLEAKALFEAMRIGAMANVVAGTIHGDSPYGVFDRVVNDLGVPKTSFKATDLIVVANPIRSADGLHRWRRITQITEVRKQWTDDPLLEKGFVDLMKYDSGKDILLPSADLINGESDVLKAIAGNVKEWAGSWDALWNNVMLRANTKKLLVDYSTKANMPKLLEARFVIHSNDEFHRISDKISEETGYTDPKRILFDWEEWLKKKIKEREIEVK